MKDLGFDFGVRLLPHHDIHIWGGGVVFFGFVVFLRKYFFSRLSVTIIRIGHTPL